MNKRNLKPELLCGYFRYRKFHAIASSLIFKSIQRARIERGEGGGIGEGRHDEKYSHSFGCTEPKVKVAN